MLWFCIFLGLGEHFQQETTTNVQNDRQKRPWVVQEKRALDMYMCMCLYGPDLALDEWPTAKNPAFWNGFAEAISETKGCPKRSGK